MNGSVFNNLSLGMSSLETLIHQRNQALQSASAEVRELLQNIYSVFQSLEQSTDPSLGDDDRHKQAMPLLQDSKSALDASFERLKGFAAEADSLAEAIQTDPKMQGASKVQQTFALQMKKQELQDQIRAKNSSLFVLLSELRKLQADLALMKEK